MLNGKWINTKPLIINEIDTSVVVYHNKFSLIVYTESKKFIPNIIKNNTKHNKVPIKKLSVTNSVNDIQDTIVNNIQKIISIQNIISSRRLDSVFDKISSSQRNIFQRDILQIDMYSRILNKTFTFTDILRLCIEKFNNYNRVAKYSNETKLKNFFYNSFFYILGLLLFSTPFLLSEIIDTYKYHFNSLYDIKPYSNYEFLLHEKECIYNDFDDDEICPYCNHSDDYKIYSDGNDYSAFPYSDIPNIIGFDSYSSQDTNYDPFKDWNSGNKSDPLRKVSSSRQVQWDESKQTIRNYWHNVFKQNTIMNDHIDNITINKGNSMTNYSLSYDNICIHNDKFIVTDNSVLVNNFIQIIKDISAEKREIMVDGNRSTSLRINTELLPYLDEIFSTPNSLFNQISPDFLLSTNHSNSLETVVSDNTLLSSISANSETRNYEQEILRIRDKDVVIDSPERANFYLSPERSLTILEVNHSVAENNNFLENKEYLENTIQHRIDINKRMQWIFSNQNSEFQPLPMWSEVPTRPTDPLEIEAWERENVLRRYWSTRLNGGYIQTDIIIRDSPFDPLPGLDKLREESLRSTISFKELYAMYGSTLNDIFEEDSLYLDTLYTNCSTSNDIFEEDSLYLDTLYTNYSDSYDIFEEDSLNLDMLYNENYSNS